MPEGSRRRPARGYAVRVQTKKSGHTHPVLLFLIFTTLSSHHENLLRSTLFGTCGTRASTYELSEASPAKSSRRGDKLRCAARCEATLICPEFANRTRFCFLSNHRADMSIEKNYWNTSRNKAHRENSCLVSVGNIVSYGNLNREAACKAFKIRVQLLDTANDD